MDSEEKKDTIPSSPPTPAERETQPEMPPEMQEVIAVITEVGVAVAKSAFAAVGKGWNSFCLIGPSLSRIADAHEILTKEAKIFNENYVHDIGQKHHSVRG